MIPLNFGVLEKLGMVYGVLLPAFGTGMLSDMGWSSEPDEFWEDY